MRMLSACSAPSLGVISAYGPQAPVCHPLAEPPLPPVEENTLCN